MDLVRQFSEEVSFLCGLILFVRGYDGLHNGWKVTRYFFSINSDEHCFGWKTACVPSKNGIYHSDCFEGCQSMLIVSFYI